MKKNVLSVALLMMSGFAFAQVGIGTANPNPAALLDVEAKGDNFKGVLIPRIPLESLASHAAIKGGKVPNSLLVFNTTANSELQPGYYFWFDKQWVRLLSGTDDFLGDVAKNEELAVNLTTELLFLRDSKNRVVSVPLQEVNLLTTLQAGAQGKYTYTSEDQTQTVIDVPADVIQNIAHILQDTSVKNEIIQAISANAKSLTGDGIIAVNGGERAVLTPTTLSITDGSITTAKIKPGGSKNLLITDAAGEVHWVNATHEVIQELVTQNEKVTLLVDGGDGTFTYYNEKGIDANGQPISGRGVKFDANTLRIVKTTTGTYEFYDKSSTTPLAVIDIAGTVIEQISEILNDTTVQNSIYTTVAAQGKPATAEDASIHIVNGEKAVLNPMQFSVANQGITTAKIKPGANKQLLVTDKTGAVRWVDVTDELLEEVVDQNETVTLLVDGGDGTFTYYNETGIDANGQVIPGRGIRFDANTLNIKEREGAAGKGIYDFYDGATSLQNPLITISTRASSIVYENNSTIIQGDNLQEVVNNIIAKVEVAQGNLAALKGNGILVNGQAQVTDAVLKEMTLTIADGAITEGKIADSAVTSYKIKNKAVTTEKMAPGPDKYILVTKSGQAQWVPASDAIIQEIVSLNEVVTLIEDNGDGTYSYYNEKAIDANGQPVKAREILIDANTLTIEETTNGTYVFKDGTFAQTGLPLATIDIVGTVVDNITEILQDSVVQTHIYNTVAAQGKAVTAADASIQIDNGGQAALHAMQLSVADEGITTAKIKPGADKHLLVTKDGIVQWVPVSDEVIGEVVSFNEKVTILDTSANNGTLVYYSEADIDADGQLVGPGVAFDANTLKIEEQAGANGVYVFYDGKTSLTAPLMTIDIAGTVIENISEILNNTTVQNDIYTTVAAQGKAVTSPNASIALGGSPDQAVLNNLELTIANEGVTTPTIAPKAVTVEKIQGGVKGQFLVTSADGVAQWISATDDPIKEILAANQAITELLDNQNGTFTYFNEADYDANGDRLPGATGITFNANTLTIRELRERPSGKGTGIFEFYDLSQEDPIAVLSVTASVIENITEILGQEEVQNQIFATIAAKGKKMQSNDRSLAITGGEKAVLDDVIININQEGVKTGHIADGAVTTAKIASTGAGKGSVLTADGLGKTSFLSPTETVKPAMQGDLAGEAGVINIVGGGENVLFGDVNKKVTIELNPGGVTGTHIGSETITNQNITNKTIQAQKLDATGATAGHVATVNANGTVSYQPVTGASIADRGNITTDGIIAVDNGTAKVLGDVALSVNTKSITADKLDATNQTAGHVATVNADGTVSYQAVNTANITEKGTISTDGIVSVDDGTDKVLGDIVLGINDGSITNEKIATGAITVDKISAGADLTKRVMVTDDQGVVKWGELDDIVTDAAGNLTTDGIVELQTGDGVNALFNNVKLGIKDQSITNTQLKDQTIEINKLSSAGSTAGMVMVTNANGGFTYVDRESIVQAGENLTLDTALEFLDGSNGVSAVLANTKIGVKEGGISTDKLADGAVIPAKLAAPGAAEHAVLTADGQGNVAYKKLSENAFAGAEAELKTDGSLAIPQDNKALLNETTIGIATSGVQNKHLANQAVTVAKMNAEAAGNGTVLTADGAGNVAFTSLEQVAVAQGQTVSSADGSISVPTGNKAALQPLDLVVAPAGINTDHLAPKAVTEDKIGTNKGAGLVLTSNGEGGATFRTLGQVIGNNGKPIVGSASIDVQGGDHAALADVSIDVNNEGITTDKLASNAVTTAKIKDQSVTTTKIAGDGTRQLLGTDASGVVKWMAANDQVLVEILNSNEKKTVLQDHGDGTFTYFNEAQVDNQGQVKPNAVGVHFNANTMSIDNSTAGIYIFKDKASNTPLATINTRAQFIIIDDSRIEYNNVEEAITGILERIEALEQLEIEKAALTGNGILVNGTTRVADAVFTPVELSIANKAVTPAKIQGGTAKQILVTNAGGDAQWVNATDEIIKDMVNTQERITLLQNHNDGTFTYFNENAVDKDGNITGAGVTFNANTLRIDSAESGKYVFYDQGSDTPLGTIDIEADVIEKITTILNDVNVKEEIFNTVAAQGKDVTHDESIVVVGGEQAALKEMTISLKDQGVTTEKIKNQAVTEDKLVAGSGKESYVPVAQADGSVKYQPIAAVLQGKPLGVDDSLELIGDASKAVLQKIDLKVKEEGIGNAHLQSHAVTTDKISTVNVALGSVLTADGSGNAVFVAADQAIAPAMNGDVKGSEAVEVVGGENVLFGDENKQVVVKIKEGGIKGTHIAAGTIQNNNIANATIEAGKLTAGTGVDNRVAVANAAGAVNYQPLSTTMLTQKGKISTDDIISVSDNGVDKVLADVELGINNSSIKAAKLHGGNAAPGAVATVGANGVTVSYQPLTTAQLTNKGSITTDGVVIVDNGVDKVLSNLKLGIKDQGITTTQLADGAVQNAQLAGKSVSADKISAAGIEAASVLVTRGDGEVVWGELGDIVTDTAGNLTTDNIITMTGGDGTNTLLKDVTLGIADQSITRTKLSSKEEGENVLRDRILVTDGQGGFDYVIKEAVQAGGEDLSLGSALEFTNDTDGLNAVLAATSLDVKNGGISTAKLADGAVTVDKMSAGTAVVNSVLTAQANGTVAYKELNATVFDGEGANLTADESITVTADNKALLQATTIAVAEGGINTQHLKNHAVTTDKISSTVNSTNAAAGAILTADGSGNTAFQSLETLATTQGKAITATDGSLAIAANKAALQDLDITIAEAGVKTNHLGARVVTADKIGSLDKEDGLILMTDGQGGAEFQSLSDAVTEVGKTLAGGIGITISGAGAAHALLDDATVNIKDGGVSELQLADNAVTTKKIADKNVTTNKISSKVGTVNATAGQVLTADGRGGVKFDAVSGASGELKGSASIDVAEGIGALLHDATVTVKDKGIQTAQLDDAAVTTAKMSSKVGNANATNGYVLTANGQGAVEYKRMADNGAYMKTDDDGALKINALGSGKIVLLETTINVKDQGIATKYIKNEAVTTDKINNLAVTNIKIANNTITGGKLENGTIQTVKLADGAVTTEKISAGNAQRGHVLTVESNGNVAFKAPTGQDVSTGDLNGSETIHVLYGEGAVLRNVHLSVNTGSIQSEHLDYEAVGSAELANNAVETKHVNNQAITAEKISSVDEDDDNTPEGYVLTSEGNGKASFKPAKGGDKAAMPKFFYAPSFYVTVVPGQRNVEVEVYDIYEEQFGAPKVKNRGAGSATLPVLEADELNYFILYYDEDVLYDVEIDDDGTLTYSVHDDVEVSTSTYFNIVFGVKE